VAGAPSARSVLLWEEVVKDGMPRAEAWVAREGRAIADRLTGHNDGHAP
jgi:hypothetical protein